MDDDLPRSRLNSMKNANNASNESSKSKKAKADKGGNSGRKQGFSFSRLSLRFLNPLAYSRTTTLTTNGSNVKHLSRETDVYDQSDNKSANKSIANLESESLSSSIGVDLYNGEQTSSTRRKRSNYNMECPLCLFELPVEFFPTLTLCSHRACLDCLQKYLRIEISESRVNISCPECIEPIHPNDIRIILNDETVLQKYESFMLRRVLVAEPDARWCPAPDCGFVVIASGCASCPKLKCDRPGCNTSFCYHCKQEWHPNQTCDAARAQRSTSQNARSSSVSFNHDTLTQRDDIKPCPCCKVLVIKMDDGSCNHMTCCVCGTEFCWLCMKEITDLHYLSPSGCTFWGKKPWSRKKKILWQLGMLVGAPVGIALIAGIAVPAIIIGIPVWVGRKLHARFEKQSSMSKHNRNILITSGVLTSVLVSPILAAVAVGIGVPILLAYVYGVVPISLCRSGGCGVSTSTSGVRIDMDEENEIGFSSNAAPDGLSVDTALSNKGVNPSIGEASLGMSTSISMGSGSHLDRVGEDGESASNAALAGSILSANASINGNLKLDIHSDNFSHKRFSVSSHSETASATVSLSERSANYSLGDDASTKALAGSLIGYRDIVINGQISLTACSAVTPVEVHVDAVHITCEKDHTMCSCDDRALSIQMKKSNDDRSNNSFLIPDSSSPSSLSPSSSYHQSSPGVHNNNNINNNNNSKMSKYESRSLEQLNNFCEVCNKTHRPCCPNHNLISPPITSSTAGKTVKSAETASPPPIRQEIIETSIDSPSISNSTQVKVTNLTNKSNTSRKGSIRSTRSDTMPNVRNHLELKRVKSIEYNQKKSNLLNKQLQFNEIKTSNEYQAFHQKEKSKKHQQKVSLNDTRYLAQF